MIACGASKNRDSSRRPKRVTDFRDQLRNNPIQDNSEGLIDKRVLCELALLAIEDGMQALRAHVDDLIPEAKQKMRYSYGENERFLRPN
jgi:hypothetical protein